MLSQCSAAFRRSWCILNKTCGQEWICAKYSCVNSNWEHSEIPSSNLRAHVFLKVEYSRKLCTDWDMHKIWHPNAPIGSPLTILMSKLVSLLFEAGSSQKYLRGMCHDTHLENHGGNGALHPSLCASPYFILYSKLKGDGVLHHPPRIPYGVLRAPMGFCTVM